MDEASSLRYSYALLGVGFLILIAAILLFDPSETAPHPYDMRLTTDTDLICEDNTLTHSLLSVEGVPRGAQSLVLTAGESVQYGLLIDQNIPGNSYTVPSCDPMPAVTLYATDITLNFIKAPTKAEVLAAIEGHVLETAVLTGTNDRSKTKEE